MTQSQWSELCLRLWPAAFCTYETDARVDWRSLTRALRKDTRKDTAPPPVRQLSEYRVLVQGFLRGELWWSGMFRLDGEFDQEFGTELQIDEPEAGDWEDDEAKITSADVFCGSRTHSPFRFDAFLLRDDGAVARLAANVTPRKPRKSYESADYVPLVVLLTEQLSRRLPATGFDEHAISIRFHFALCTKDESPLMEQPRVMPENAQVLCSCPENFDWGCNSPMLQVHLGVPEPERAAQALDGLDWTHIYAA